MYRICHVLTVRRLRWRRTSEYEDNSCLQLASCSLDHSVRIYNIDITSWRTVVMELSTCNSPVQACSRENGRKFWVQWFLGSNGWTNFSYVWLMDGLQGNPLTNHKLPFSTQTIPEIVAPKALTRMGNTKNACLPYTNKIWAHTVRKRWKIVTVF